jgi:hypothetical protein
MKTKLHLLAVLPFLASDLRVAVQLHPIVEVETGFFVGPVAEGKWMKHEGAGKALKGGEKYRLEGVA